MLNEQILSITDGIINGTFNYILDSMSFSKSFEEALINAQKLGYAESDSTFLSNIGGFDAAHLISILCMIAFGIRSPFTKN